LTRSRLSAVLEALLVTFLWSSSYVLVKIGLQEIRPLTLVAYRYAVASLLLLIIALSRGQIYILRNREIWLVSFCGLCCAWVEFALIGHLVLYLTEWLLVPVVMAGGMLALAEIAGALARPGSGLLSDRVFGGNRKSVLIIMAAIASAMCFVVGFFGSYLSWAIYPVLFLLGVGGIGFGGMWLTMVGEFGGRRGAGTSVGLATVFSMFGSTVGPIAFGYIVDISGSYKLSWLSLTFIAALCALLFLFVREEKRKI